MASRLIRWTLLVVVAGAAVAWPLLPPGKALDRAWALLDPERAHLEPVWNEVRSAERVLRRETRNVHAQEEAAAVRAVATRALAEGRTVVLDRIRGEDLLSGGAAMDRCPVRQVELGEVVGGDLDGDPDGRACSTVSGLSERTFRVRVVDPGVHVVRLTTEAYPMVRVLHEGAGVSSWQAGRSIAYFVADRPGAYEVTVTDRRFRPTQPGAFTLAIVRARDGALGEGVVEGPELDADVAYRLELPGDGPSVVTVMGGVARVSDGRIVSGPATALLAGGGHRVLSARTEAGGTAVHVWGTLPERGRRLSWNEPVTWVQGADEPAPVFEVEVPDERILTASIRRDQPGGGSAGVPWLGLAGTGAFDAVTPLAPGRYRITPDPGRLAEGAGRLHSVEVRCAAAVVPLEPGPNRWAGADECRPDRTNRTAWRLSLERPTVLEVGWEGEGDLTARPVGRPESDPGHVYAEDGRLSLQAGSWLLEGTGAAARAITVLDLGTREAFLTARIAELSAGGPRGSGRAEALVGVAVGPQYPRAGGVTTHDARTEVAVRAGTVDGRAYCLLVVHTLSLDEVAAQWARSDIGACRYWARYGPPGASMARWLAAGGSELGARRRGPEVWTHPGFGLRGADEPPDDGLWGRVGPVSGLRADAEACLQGDRGRCASAWSAEPVAQTVRLGFDPLRVGEDRAWAFYGAEGTILDDLEADFGPDAFARFWAAEGPLEQAFRDAFGASRAEWTYRWAVARLGPRTPRGSVLLDAVLGLVACGLLALAAAGAAGRRQVA